MERRISKPVLWFDVKGASYEAPVAQPLEASYYLSSGFHRVVEKGSYICHYPKDEVDELGKSVHVSCLKNGLMADVEAASELSDAEGGIDESPVDQCANWLADTAMSSMLIDSNAEVWMPFWNFPYEAEIVNKAISIVVNDGRPGVGFRPVEMRGVSAFEWAMRRDGIDQPKSGAWRSAESLQWYFKRAKQVLGFPGLVDGQAAVEERIEREGGNMPFGANDL